MIADDNPQFLRKFVRLLAAGFDVVVTPADGESALDFIQ
jgi:hypothetical protein